MQDTKMASPEMQGGEMKEEMTKDKIMKNEKMMETTPAAPMAVMLAGSEGHMAAGKVSFTKEMGKEQLVLTDIDVEKVPDGHVYLAKHGDRTQGIDLGVLKQFTGTVYFALPAMTNPEDYDSVIIYCKKFKVEIGRAKLDHKM
ncbi:MAG: DM13 domain-containing protein [Desulfobacteraceae bacterium]|nr:DM13 domain-containing protein [Desulfobacteraceae bacterium]